MPDTHRVPNDLDSFWMPFTATKAFKDKSTRKLYWAIVTGAPVEREGLIDAPLAKLAGKGGEKMVIDEKQGKSAQTVYRQLHRAGRRAAWLALSPLTGRTHQLRAHCEAMTPEIHREKEEKPKPKAKPSRLRKR